LLNGTAGTDEISRYYQNSMKGTSTINAPKTVILLTG
jgi:hypothetical protein